MLSIHHRSRQFFNIFQVSLLIIVSIVCLIEAKEFDWADLGVSLTNPKSPIANGGANNLRILVSPQRRMTKK